MRADVLQDMAGDLAMAPPAGVLFVDGERADPTRPPTPPADHVVNIEGAP
jgi:hypothetical protein